MPIPFNPAAAAVVLVLGTAAGPGAVAAGEAEARELFAVLRLPELLEIMHAEGLQTAEETAEGVFGGEPPQAWTRAIGAILDPARMEQDVLAAMAEATEGVDVAPIIAFFADEPGRTFIDIELAARRAMLDDEVEQMAKEAAVMALDEQGPRVAQIDRFMAVNDLVEGNVVASMNAAYAFNMGVMAGGGLPAGLTEEDILKDVWAQEPQIRADTEEWVYSFLLLAHGPVPEADLETYIAFSETEAGQAGNRILLDTFNGVFEAIAFDLGRTVGRFMTTAEL